MDQGRTERPKDDEHMSANSKIGIKRRTAQAKRLKMKKQFKNDVATRNKSSAQDELDSVTPFSDFSFEGRYLIGVLRAFWNDLEPPRPPEGFDERRFARFVYFQRVGAMVADELEKRPEWFSERFMNAITRLRALEILRDVAFHTTVSKVEAILEENGIRYVPLKGAIMKNLYPQSYHRPARDYDVLINESEMLRAEALLIRNLGYEEEGVALRHYALKNKSGLLPVELHRFLLGREDVPIIDDPWSRVLPVEAEESKKTLKYRLTAEDFYLHMVGHLTKHWLSNMTTIRTFVDVWVFDRKFGAGLDRTTVDESLRKLGILDFARNVERAGKVWFGDQESDEIVDVTTSQLFNRTLYGSALHTGKRKSRFRRLMDAVLCVDQYKWRYLEERRRSFGKRILWRFFYVFKAHMERLKKGKVVRTTYRRYVRRDPNYDPKKRKEFERLMGIADLERSDS